MSAARCSWDSVLKAGLFGLLTSGQMPAPLVPVLWLSQAALCKRNEKDIREKIMLALGLTLAPLAHAWAAGASYTFTGTPYASAQAPYTNTMRLQASFTTPEALPANLISQPIGLGTGYPVARWSFNDGVHFLTQMNAVFDDVPVPLSVSTDAAGNISAIQMVLKWPLPPYVAGQKRGSIAVFGVDENYIVQALTSTCNEWTGDACTQVADESTGVSLGGTWARTPANPKPVPGLGLPGLLLLSFGVFGFALRTRRRL